MASATRCAQLIVYAAFALGVLAAGGAAAAQDAARQPGEPAGEGPAGEGPAAVAAAVQPTAGEPTAATPARNASPPSPPVDAPRSLSILAVGVAIVLSLIILLKINAFIALITAAMAVSLLAVALLGAGTWFDSIERVAAAFGSSAGKIGIVIGLAAVIGQCMLDSGAADRIVRSFLKVLGEKRAAVALAGSGYVLGIPVFFDTVFYLLVPLARSLYRRTRHNYLLYVLAIATGGAITHTLVPPTPGPLVMAAQLQFDVGYMILVGALVAIPAAAAGLCFSYLANRWMPIPMRPLGDQPEPPVLTDAELPPLWLSLLPILLPVLLISTNTVLQTAAKTSLRRELVSRGETGINDARLTAALRDADGIEDPAARSLARWAGFGNVVGNANLALLLSSVVAAGTVVAWRKLTRAETARLIETSLMSGGVIILITAAGGAFGETLKAAQVGEAIQQSFAGLGAGAGLRVLLLGFGISAVLKIAQGSSTVAMITGSSMLAGIARPEVLGYHPVYLACAISAGSLVGSWMNDSGFWIFAKMGGLTEVETLKSWTVLLIVMAFVALLATALLAAAMPMPFGAG